MKAFRDEAIERLSKATGLAPEAVDRVLEVPDAERGDFAFPCFPLAKERRAPPPKIAAEVAAGVAAALAPGGRIQRAVATGPYVNLFADRARLAEETLATVAAEGDRFGGGDEGRGKTVVLDYSSPNVAKPLAFHHLRSTMIGNSLARLYAARGWRVVGINYLGDWGTGFGKLLLAIELWGDGPLAAGDANGLNALYVRVNAEIRSQPALEDRARAWFKRLEDGDPVARDLWRRSVELSMTQFQSVYDLLDVRFDVISGESFYEGRMESVIDELRRRGLLEESEGALVVQVAREGDEKPMPPALIVKSDGATLYLTRDLAAAVHRHEAYGFDRSLYVIGTAQALHITQLQRVLERAERSWAKDIRHVPFGLVFLGGAKAATREGRVVLLHDVLRDAIAKVERTIREKNADLADAAGVARRVGVGAVVFNDLKNRRTNDVEFDLDAILSFEGKTGPYVMYSHARACSILARHGGPVPAARPGTGARLSDPAEEALVRVIARFPERVARAVDLDEPSEVATHLLDLCEAFHAYHTKGGRDAALRVLSEDEGLRAARLLLVDAVRRTLANGLRLLGISAPTQM